MVTKDAWRVETPDLIRTELEKRLPGECEIIAVKPDSIYYEGEEHRYVTVLFKGVHPEEDHRRINAIDRDIHKMLWELGYDPVPSIHYQREGMSLA